MKYILLDQIEFSDDVWTKSYKPNNFRNMTNAVLRFFADMA